MNICEHFRVKDEMMLQVKILKRLWHEKLELKARWRLKSCCHACHNDSTNASFIILFVLLIKSSHYHLAIYHILQHSVTKTFQIIIFFPWVMHWKLNFPYFQTVPKSSWQKINLFFILCSQRKKTQEKPLLSEASAQHTNGHKIITGMI